MSRWIKSMIAKRNVSTERSVLDADLLKLAKASAPQMFRGLIDQMTSDIFEFTQETGEHIDTAEKSVAPIGTVYTAKRDGRYPVFDIRVEWSSDGQPILNVFRSITKSSASGSARKTLSIQIVARGQGQFFFECDGDDRTVEQASSFILEPILSLL